MSEIAPKRTRGKRGRVAGEPKLIGQPNCETLLGLSPRKHLELVRTLKIPHFRVGSLVLVEVDVYMEALQRFRVESANDDSADIDVEAVRRSLGVTKR